MIYPRLKIAKDLLTENGVIFISIDYNEVSNLKKFVMKYLEKIVLYAAQYGVHLIIVIMMQSSFLMIIMKR